MHKSGSSCSCKVKVPADKTMRPTTKYFRIEAPEYKPNAVLRAQK